MPTQKVIQYSMYSPNTMQQHATGYRVGKPTQHITFNNVGSCSAQNWNKFFTHIEH